jgi:moderate conductance mechanosensitive channel
LRLGASYDNVKDMTLDILEVITDIFSNTWFQIVVTIVVAAIVQLIIRSTISQVVMHAVRSSRFTNKDDERKREETLITIFRTALAVVIWTMVIVIILWELKVNIAALMTGAGVIGIVVGFGAQNTIKDFLAGIFILAENQYRVGDIITMRVAGTDVSGVVEDITIRITRLRDLDGNLHIVQNSMSVIITNHSFGYANVNVDVSVAYESDIDKVEKVMNDVGKGMTNDEQWAGAIIEPIQFLRVDSFDDSAVRVKALGKVEPAMQWDVAGEFRRRVKKAFEKHDIIIPFPQMVLHTHE